MSRLGNLRQTLHVPLFVAGALGFVVFFALLPPVHPDAAVEQQIAADRFRVIADSHVVTLGLDPREYDVEVGLRRNASLLSHLQQNHGLRHLRNGLRTGEFNPLPAYYQRVRYRRSRADVLEREVVVELHFLMDGRLVQLETPDLERRAGNPDALSSLGLDPDTSRVRRYVVMNQEGEEDPIPDGIEGTAIEPEQMARYHLDRSAWAALPFVKDSVRVIQGDGGGAVDVRMRADTLIAGTQPVVRLEVGMGGNLQTLVLDEYEADSADRAPESGIVLGTESRDGPMGAITGIMQIVLFITLLVLLFRRLDRRLVDTRGALRDSLWGGLWGLLASGLIFGYSVVAESGPGALPFFLAVVLTFTTGVGAVVLIFVASAVGDSYAREAWPHSVRSLDLLRKISPVNRMVGGSLLHGLAVAGIIIGLATLFLWIPGVQIDLENGFPGERSLSPVISVTASAIWYGIYLIFAVIAGIGGMARRWSKIASFAVPVLVLMLLDVTPIEIDPMPQAIVAGLVIGSVIVWTFFRLGIIAAMVATVTGSIMVELAPGWLAAPVPETVDAVIAFVLLGGLTVVGFVGAAGRESAAERAEFVPSYLKELSEQQRIERELEIARDVQMSFLPRHMPKIVGVDAAAVCVPAHEVGGDYYDLVVLDDHRLAIMIGDVSGKGIKAAFYMTLVKGIIQTLALADIPPRQVLVRLNDLFCRNAPPGTFISLIYGVFDTREGTFTFARAGHNPALIMRDGEAFFERPRGMAIGLDSGVHFDRSLSEHQVTLAEDDILLLYTDGVSEAMNSAREQFGEERIAQTMLAAGDRRASDLLQELRQKLDDFTLAEAHFDDMTLIVIRRMNPLEMTDGSTRATSTRITPRHAS